MAWLPLALGLGGALFGMLNKSKSQTTTTTVDPVTDYYRRLMLGAAAGAAGLPAYGSQTAIGARPTKHSGESAYQYSQRLLQWMRAGGGSQIPGMGSTAPSITGVDPQTQAAIDAFSQYSNLGLTGANALSGNAQAQGQFFNPYQQEVVDRVTGDYGRLNDMAQQGINDYYTRAGSFGGSRQAISSGQASADIARNLGDTVAGLRYTGFNDAMQRAFQTANLGFGATGALPGLGQYAQRWNDPNLRQSEILKGVLAGSPYGQQTTQPVGQGNPFGDFLGWWLLGQGIGGGGGGGSKMVNWSGGNYG